MPYKDQFGIWRQDDFGESVGKKPKRCPECKYPNMDYNRLIDEDEHDFDLEQDWQVRSVESGDEREHLQSLLAYSPAYAVCDECNVAIPYGPVYYYNPATNNYDLQKPLTRAQAEKAELEAERERQIAAGQLNLF